MSDTQRKPLPDPKRLLYLGIILIIFTLICVVYILKTSDTSLLIVAVTLPAAFGGPWLIHRYLIIKQQIASGKIPTGIKGVTGRKSKKEEQQEQRLTMAEARMGTKKATKKKSVHRK